MYATPATYADVQASTDRRVTVQIQYGFGMDPTAADDVTGITGDFLPMSNPGQVLDSNYVMTPGLVTFEGDGIPTAVSAGMVVPPLEAQDYPPGAGIWSADISDADGNMSWEFTIQLSAVHTSAFSIHTSEVHILRARVRYYSGETLTRDTSIDSTSEVFYDSTRTSFDKIVVTVLQVTQPYHHVRIVELEFGASVTLSNASIGETVSYITEIDPLGLTTPLSELDFTLINVDGAYDADNPSSLLPSLPIGVPVDLSFTTISPDGTQVTIPMGTFYITDRVGEDTQLRITAQDARGILQGIYQSIQLVTTQSLGDLFESLFTDLQISYVIDDDVYTKMPTADVVIDSQTEMSLLQQIGYIEQFYDIRVLPGRDGYLHVGTRSAAETVGTITAETLISYPEPATSQTYNGVSVQYGPPEGIQTYNLDLRTDMTEARSVLSVSNPLILDLSDAQRIANALAPLLSLQLYKAEAIADASLDPGDVAPIGGRWSQEDPTSYSLTYLEYTFDGGFTMVLRGTRV